MAPLAAQLTSGTRLGGRLERLKEIVLLGGSVRPGRLAGAIGRPVFALPIDNQRSVLNLWQEQVADLAQDIGRPELLVRVMLDQTSAAVDQSAWVTSRAGLASVELQRDPQDFRGTGGVLRDLSASYDPDDLLLVANAAQVLSMPLCQCVAELADQPGDVVVVDHEDGTPSGLMLVRVVALAGIPSVGFVDMKEQALPEIAKTHRVGVATFPQATAWPMRSLEQYIVALRQYALGHAERRCPFSERLSSAFNIVEQGASVDSSARLQDSVVLAGGSVEAGATLVQSVVCSGGRVRRGEVIVDQVVTAGKRSQTKD